MCADSQSFHQLRDDCFLCHRVRVDLNFRFIGCLVRAIDPREVLDLALAGLLVEPLGIALLADIQRRIDMHLDEVAVVEQLTGGIAVGAERRDKGGNNDDTGIGEQLGDFPHAADVLGAVGFAHGEVFAQAMANVVTVQQHGVITTPIEFDF